VLAWQAMTLPIHAVTGRNVDVTFTAHANSVHCSFHLSAVDNIDTVVGFSNGIGENCRTGWWNPFHAMRHKELWSIAQKGRNIRAVLPNAVETGHIILFIPVQTNSRKQHMSGVLTNNDCNVEIVHNRLLILHLHTIFRELILGASRGHLCDSVASCYYTRFNLGCTWPFLSQSNRTASFLSTFAHIQNR